MLAIKEIGPEHNDRMLEILLESPMESDVLSMVLDRSPDMFLVPRIFFDEFKAFGFFREDLLVGFVMICEKELYVNGKAQLVGYLANMYVQTDARKLGWLYKASQLLFEELHQKTDIGFASTVQGNKATESMIGRRIGKFPLMPYSQTVGLQVVHTLLITFKKRQHQKSKGLKLMTRRANPSDLPKIAKLLDHEYRNRLFGPVMTEKHLREVIEKRPGFSISDYWVAERRDKLVGVCSAWDTSAFRNIRVMAYMKRFKWVYRMYSLVAPLFRFPRLPKAGEPFRELIVNDVAIVDRDPVIFEALIRSIYREARVKGYNMIEVGSYSGDPLLKAVKPFFTQEVYSHTIVGCSREDYLQKSRIDLTRPFVDIALT